MSAEGHISGHRIYFTIAGVLAIIALAGAAGYWLGAKSVSPETDPATPDSTKPVAASARQGEADPIPFPPLFFSVDVRGAAPIAAEQEIAMAAAAGIHQYVVPAPVPWEGQATPSLDAVNRVVELDPDARMLISLDLNPPPAWLEAHPDEAEVAGGKRTGFASIGSEAWLNEVKGLLDALLAVLGASHPDRVLGYVIHSQEGGSWSRSSGYDASPANLAAFARWLKAVYETPEALQQAWNDPDVGFDHVAVPEEPSGGGPEQVFFSGADLNRHRDYLRFASESCATAIAGVADQVKRVAGDEAMVLVAYGASFEAMANDSGQFALGRLLESKVDGFVTPVSYSDRGLGGVGGPMGPMDSAQLHGKKWYLIDDTRTGIAMDVESGEIRRPKNVQADDYYRVQQRNFAAAITHEAGLFWSDSEGEGRLHDEDMWDMFGGMWRTYQALLEAQARGGLTACPAQATLAVVVDEESRFVQQCDAALNEALLLQVRDSALRAGVPVRFYLLSDVIEERAPKVPVYLFANAFCLSPSERERLLGLLQRHQAAAIWMYAPGYFAEGPSAENIAATTRMNVKAFEGAAPTRSVLALPGKWMETGATLGKEMSVAPLFYIDDPETDTIATYAEGGKASLAINFFEEGWTSIYCAEPAMTPGLLREILGILELPIPYQSTSPQYFDAVYMGLNMMGIHAREGGERSINLNLSCDVQDLLTPEIGWQQKRVFSLPMRAGDTRLLSLTPAESAEKTPEEPGLEPEAPLDVPDPEWTEDDEQTAEPAPDGTIPSQP